MNAIAEPSAASREEAVPIAQASPTTLSPIGRLRGLPRRFATILALAIALVAGTAHAQERVELAPLEGDAGDRVRGRLDRALADRFEVARVGADTPVAPWAVRVDGRVRVGRRRFVARLRVRTADGAEERVTGRFPASARGVRRLAGRVARGVEDVWASRATRDAADAPTRADVRDDRPARVASAPSEGSRRPPSEPSTDGAASVGARGSDPSGSRPSSVAVRTELRVTHRRFAYRDDVFGDLRGYDLPAAPSVAVAGRWYPLAHLGDGIGAAFGLDLRAAHTLFAESERGGGNAGEVFPTVAYEWQAGLRGRLRLGEHALSAGVGFVEQAFLIEPSGPRAPGRDPDPDLPGVRYRAVRPDVAARLELPLELFVEVELAWRFVVDAGPIGDDAWFPHHTASGFDGALRVGWRWTPWLAVSISGRYVRTFYAMGSQLGDRRVAGGATDELLDLGVGLEIRDPGE